jgi:sensor histidine kinase YesM
MRMTTILSLGKLASGALLAIVISAHLPVFLHMQSKSIVTFEQTAPEVTRELASTETQIVELQRRTLALEQANLAVQLAALQAQVNIDHQILLAMALMMITLAIEAAWRMAGKGKTVP